MRRISAILAAVAALVACSESPQQMQARMDQERAAAQPTIQAMLVGWQAHAAAGHADSIAAYFADQGHMMPPNEPAAVGRAAIRASFAKMYAVYDEKITITSENLMVNGPAALDRGTFTLTLTPKKGAPKGTRAVRDKGKYLNHLHQAGDHWEIMDLIWNSDNPAVPAPAARPAPARRR